MTGEGVPSHRLTAVGTHCSFVEWLHAILGARRLAVPGPNGRRELMKIRTVLVLVSSTAALLCGCGSLPDAKPFADASHALSTSVVASGHAVADSMTDAGNVLPLDKPAYDRLRQDVETSWADRAAATQAAARYSESIADLIAAGNASADSARKVADALNTLADAVHIPSVTAEVGAASNLGSFVAERIAIVRASQSLESALGQAQPAIDRIAEHIVGESDRQLKSILLDVYKNIDSGIKSAYEEDSNFAREARKRRQVQRQMVLRDPAALPRLEQYDRVQASVSASLEERDRKLDQAAAAYRARLQLINAMSVATLAWAQAHRDLATAIREKRKVSTTELTATVAELRDLSKKVSAL